VTHPIPILRIGSVLIATVQVELRDSVADVFQQDILSALERTNSKGLVIDITALDFVDSYVARVLAETSRMTRLLGAETVLVGMRPQVSATLIRMGFRMDGVRTALNLDEGLTLLGLRVVSDVP
jgi:rsbT antagonist protein RsbS